MFAKLVESKNNGFPINTLIREQSEPWYKI